MPITPINALSIAQAVQYDGTNGPDLAEWIGDPLISFDDDSTESLLVLSYDPGDGPHRVEVENGGWVQRAANPDGTYAVGAIWRTDADFRSNMIPLSEVGS